MKLYEVGQDFNPYEEMEELLPGKSKDIIGSSLTLPFRDLGQVRLDVVTLDYSYRANFLGRLDGQNIFRSLDKTFGYLAALIHSFDASLKEQPDLIFSVRWEGMITRAGNNRAEDKGGLNEEALFDWFSEKDSNDKGLLVVSSSLAFLKQPRFRFDWRSSSSSEVTRIPFFDDENPL